MTDNPILARLMRHETATTHDPLVLLAGVLFLLTAASIAVLRQTSYPVYIFGLLPLVLLIAILFVVVLIIAVIMALIRTETRTEQHQLLYLTGVSESQVAWGLVLWITWRTRVFLLLCAWLIWLLGMTLTINTFDAVQHPFSTTFTVPDQTSAVAYGIGWMGFAAGVVVSVVGTGALNGLQGVLQFESFLRIAALLFLMDLPAGFFFLMGLVAAEDAVPYVVALMLVVLAAKIALLAVAKWWHIPIRAVLNAYFTADQHTVITWATLVVWGVCAWIAAGLLGWPSVWPIVIVAGTFFLFYYGRGVLGAWRQPRGFMSLTILAIQLLLLLTWGAISLIEPVAAISVVFVWAMISFTLYAPLAIGAAAINSAVGFVWDTVIQA